MELDVEEERCNRYSYFEKSILMAYCSSFSIRASCL
jgi:hypothetical protein